MESPKKKEIVIALDPILSQIMPGLARAKPEDVAEYLKKAHWLYFNVDRDLFLEKTDNNSSMEMDSAKR
jgi:hypothetical protein